MGYGTRNKRHERGVEMEKGIEEEDEEQEEEDKGRKTMYNT